MNNLKTSTKVLIALSAAALVLGVVLFITMPEPFSDLLANHTSLIMSGEHFKGVGHGFRAAGRRGFNPGGILILGIIAFFIFRSRKFHSKGHHGRAILDELYAEEKISEEEYRRRRTIIEEE